MAEKSREAVMAETLDVERAVRERYSQAAQQTVRALCCPVDYRSEYLKILPQEILERDYGCGDPSQFVREGETVLDLGSGGGKICYIAAQVVGKNGRIIGVDMNDEMLALARKYQNEIGDKLGYHNVEFHRGKIQDLQPLVPDESIDVVISNCVLNLVREQDKRQLFSEIHRVLKRGGRAAISDIVSNEPVPEAMKTDPDLWSGCISGAFQETELLKAFEDAGFYGIHIAKRDENPWQIVNGIEFRAITVIAYKGKGATVRSPRETKGLGYNETTEAGGNCCGPNCC
jgi:arsenite methyltransferase